MQRLKKRRMKKKWSHFYKIVSPSCIQDRCLAIPKKFRSCFGKELSNVAVLKVHRRQEWNVELREEEGQVWFQDGWHEFLEYHSICAWHMLVFRYDGNSQFRVIIFDKSASEIKYPCDINTLEEPNIASQISLHYLPPKLVMDRCDNQKTSKPCTTSSQHRRSFLEHNDTYRAKTISKSDSGFCKQRKWISIPRKPLSFQGKETISWATRTFTSENPFCVVCMQPSQVRVWFMLALPTVFTKMYLTKDERVVTLRVSDGRTWQVHCAGRLRVRLFKGWKAFVLDNNLEENDTCIFELVDKMELKVTIFRVHQDSTQSKSISTQPKSQRCNLICRDEYNGMKRKLTDSKKNGIFEPVEEEEAYPMVDKNDVDDALLDCSRPYSSSEPIASSTTAIKVTPTWVDEECCTEQEFDVCVHYRERPTELVDDREISYVSKEGCEIFGSNFKNAAEGVALGFYKPSNHEPTVFSPSNGTLVRPFNDDLHGMKNKRGPLELPSSMFCKDLQSNETKTERCKLAEDETDDTKQEPGRKESSILMQGPTKVGLHHTVSAARRVMTSGEKDGSIIAARAFTSENPF